MQDVHDRALFYYRLLQHDVSVAERVVNPPKQAVSVFADTQSNEIKDRIFDEFNSLSVVYQKVWFSFLLLNVSVLLLPWIGLCDMILEKLDSSLFAFIWGPSLDIVFAN